MGWGLGAESLHDDDDDDDDDDVESSYLSDMETGYAFPPKGALGYETVHEKKIFF